MRKHVVVLGSIIVAIVILAGLVLWWHNLAPGASGTQPTGSSSFTVRHGVMPSANQHLLEASLSSSDVHVEVNALAIELRSDVLAQNQPLLPPGTTVSLDPTTFFVSPEGDTGEIEAKTSRGETFLLHLVREDGAWLVAYTEER